jgi:hypothetical protein
VPETPGQTDDFGGGSTGGGSGGGGGSSAPHTVDLTPPGSSPPVTPPGPPPTRPRRPREDDEDELDEFLAEPILEPAEKRTRTDIDRLGAIDEIEGDLGIGGPPASSSTASMSSPPVITDVQEIRPLHSSEE